VQIRRTPGTPRPWGSAPTPYEELGGEDRVKALVNAFYDIVEESSPVLTSMLPADTSVSRLKLFEFLSGWMGGPQLYWERRGHPRLRLRHAPFAIDEFAADEWARCMDEALVRAGVEGPIEAFLATELRSVAVGLRNRL